MLKNILQKYITCPFRKFNEIKSWKKRNYLYNSPQFIKESILLRYGVPNAQWVETGTGRGITTKFLSKSFSYVYTIEPSKYLYEQAIQNLKLKNVNFFNDTSENILSDLLSN